MLVLDVLDVVDGVLLAADVDVAALVLEEELVVAVGFDVAAPAGTRRCSLRAAPGARRRDALPLAVVHTDVALVVDVDADVAVLVLDALEVVDGVLLLVAAHADVVRGVGVDVPRWRSRKGLWSQSTWASLCWRLRARLRPLMYLRG